MDMEDMEVHVVLLDMPMKILSSLFQKVHVIKYYGPGQLSIGVNTNLIIPGPRASGHTFRSSNYLTIMHRFSWMDAMTLWLTDTNPTVQADSSNNLISKMTVPPLNF